MREYFNGNVVVAWIRTLWDYVYSWIVYIFCGCYGNKVSSESATRQIEVGAPEEGSKKKHNKIKTSKYTLLMFVPQNLAEQFRRVVNFYFLIVTVIAIVIDSPVSPLTSIAPLSFMVMVTAVKQAYEDWLRHKADNRVNNKIVEIVHKGVIKEVRNSSIAPGTLVRVKRGREVPADLVLLCSTGETGKCFVTTANLDGETNLKTLRVPPPLVGLTPDILPPHMRIEVPQPVADLYTFYGRLEIPAHDSLALSTDHLMLRGSRVKNTEWAIGCAVYTGEDTKLALNSKYSGNKFSSCELAVNGFLMFFIFLLIVEMIVSLAAKMFIERANPERDMYLGEGTPYPAPFSVLMQDFLSFLLLYYYIIPMSLYVTIELYKFIGALFIGWDEDLRCDETGRPAVANTSDLNEELGQVEVLFSDKTGTLTKNLMAFKACSVNGKLYEEKDALLYDVDRFNEPVDVFQSTDVKFFFTILALCHSVQISNEDMKKLSARLSLTGDAQLLNFFRKKKIKSANKLLNNNANNANGNINLANGNTQSSNGNTNSSYENTHSSNENMNSSNGNANVNGNGILLDDMTWNDIIGSNVSKTDYQASSPDERALVEAADRLGVSFVGEEGNNLLLRVGQHSEIYERLQLIEFTSERKRMSVIVRDKDGRILLLCKGAESSVFPLCANSSMVSATNKDIDTFASAGLRTLAVAYRHVPDHEYHAVAESIKRLDGRSASALQQVTQQYRVLERQLTLVGATGVEDCLQDDVAHTLHALRRAGIKTWVLTGDKVETAINVAQSCAHISENDRRMFVLGAEDETAVQAHLNECRRIVAEPSYRDLTLVVDGTSMGAILDTQYAAAFAEISLKCTAVLCCRLSPLQKAKIVKLIKGSPSRPITAAIGDGANDISMIQEAHVGFGIYGREGHQAARSADFAFTKFSMVKKMLLVLGHWYYQRLATLIHYFFYKNLVLGNIMVMFQLQSAFSTQSIFDSMYLTLYNLGFTSLPCLVLSVTEQRWPKEVLLDNPMLYRLISRNRLMSWPQFAAWCISAVYHTAVIYLFAHLTFRHSTLSGDGKTVDLWCYGALLFHLLVLVVNLKLWLHVRYHALVFVVSAVGSVLLYMLFNTVYSLLHLNVDGDVLGTYTRLLASPAFWVLNVLVAVSTLCPDMLLRLLSDRQATKHITKTSTQTVFSTRL